MCMCGSMHARQCLRKRSNIGEVVIDFAVPLKRGHALRATIRCTVGTWVKVQQMVAGVGRVREVSEAEDLQVPVQARLPFRKMSFFLRKMKALGPSSPG